MLRVPPGLPFVTRRWTAPGLPWPGWGQAEDVGPGDGWVQAACPCFTVEMVPPIVAGSMVGWGGTSMGALLIALGDAFCPAGLGDVGDKSTFLPLPWDLPSRLGFLLCAWWINLGLFHPSHLP